MFTKTYKVFLMLAVFTILGLAMPAQAAGWVAQSSGVSVNLRDIDMVDQNTGFAVGDGGTILKTTNGGKNWSTVYTSVGDSFYGIDMYSSSIGWVVGMSGKILKTSNGGTSWDTQISGTSFLLQDVDVYSGVEAAAVGVGGIVLRTTNGTTWTMLQSDLAATLYGVEFSSCGTSRCIWTVGTNGTVVFTSYANSGDTPNWTNQTSGTTAALYDIKRFPSTNNLRIAGSGVVLTTANSGSTWSAIQNGAMTQTFQALDIFSSGIYTVGSSGLIYKGTQVVSNWTWAMENSNTSQGLNSIAVQSSPVLTAWAVGVQGTIVRYDETAPTAPSNLAKTTADTDNTPTFTWTASSDDISGTVGSGGITYQYALDGSAIYTSAGSNTSATVVFAVSNGSHTISVRAVDAAYNYSELAILIFTINAPDTTLPSVGGVTPTSAVVGVAQTYSANYSDNIGVASCQLVYDDLGYVPMTVAGGVNGIATKSYPFSSVGNHTLQAKCYDAAGNTGLGPVTTITVSAAADTIAPTVGAISPATATSNSAQSFTVTYSDNVGVSSCELFVNDISQGNMSLAGTTSGTATKSLTLFVIDSYVLKAKCSDGTNTTWGAATTVTVTAAVGSDNTAPYVSSVTPTTAVATYSQSFTVSYSDTVGVTSCNLYVDSADQGPMTLAGTTSGSASRTYSFSNTTSHTLQARCSDAAGNVGLGALTTVSVSAAPAVSADTTAPSTPPGLQKVSNESDATPTFAWNATSDNVGVTSYLIQIDNGSLIDNGGSTSYTIPSNLSNGTHSFKVLAKDAAGNTSPTSSFTFTVNASSAAVSCPLTMQKAYKSFASKAVHYITTDCTKRPFKNGPSFFTYFDSWSEVITTTQTILNSIANDSLGFTPAGPKYDPKYGALVKIVTDPKVYLLLGTEKYWIISESTFNGLKYDWKWIEDVDSGLLDKYSIGSEITYTDHHPNYTIIKYAGFANTYRLEPDPDDYSKQVKRWIKNEKVFNALKFRWDRIVTVPNSETYKDGKVMDEGEVNL